jgi:hypothetical protein
VGASPTDRALDYRFCTSHRRCPISTRGFPPRTLAFEILTEVSKNFLAAA